MKIEKITFVYSDSCIYYINNNSRVYYSSCKLLYYFYNTHSPKIGIDSGFYIKNKRILIC